MNCSLPDSSVHGIFQARILERVPFPSPGGLPDPGIKPLSPASPALQEDSLWLSHQEALRAPLTTLLSPQVSGGRGPALEEPRFLAGEALLPQC